MSNEHPAHSNTKPTRRNLLFTLGAALNAAAGVLVAIPIIGYLFSAFQHRKSASEEWINLGKVDGFPHGQTRLATYRNPFTRPWDGATAEIPCWVRRTNDGKFQVFAINCTHLGCPVRWFQESQLFLCPCHGGAYYADGERAAGPPPRGLFQYAVKTDKGQLFIRGGILPTLSEPLS